MSARVHLQWRSTLTALTRDESIWRQSIAAGTEQVGQLPPYQSLWNKWKASPPDWMPKWAFFVYDQLKVSKAIRPGKWGLQQFVTGQPYWETYLKGQQSDPKKALQAAQDAVAAQIKQAGG